MGFMELSDFREDVGQALGDTGVANERLDRWVNHAYLDVAGAVEFDVFDKSHDESGVSTGSFAEPDDVRVVKHLVQGNLLLERVPKSEFFRLNRSENGQPRKWVRHSGSIHVVPQPSSSMNFTVVYMGEPTRLSGGTDTTEIPEIWDPAVFLLGVHYGLLAIGEETRAFNWLERALNYVRSRITESDFREDASGLQESLASVGGEEDG